MLYKKRRQSENKLKKSEIKLKLRTSAGKKVVRQHPNDHTNEKIRLQKSQLRT